MTWLNPWAWLGIGTLAVPVLVHLLARNRARARRLATLRFVGDSPPTSTRPSRITDPILLLVRLLVLAVAVSALARPSMSGNPASALGQEPPLTRVILVDAGPSMSRLTPDGEPAIDVARRRAAEAEGSGAAPEALVGLDRRGARGPARTGNTYVVEVPGSSGSLAVAADGAAAYLARVPGRREILIHSVVGVGALPLDVERARTLGIPIGLEQIELAPSTPDSFLVRHPASESRISVMASEGGGIVAGWVRASASDGALDSLRQAGMAYLAAELSGSPAIDPEVPVVLALGAGASPAGEAGADWTGTSERVGDLLLALRRDPGLGALSREAHVDAGSWDAHTDPSGAFPLPMVAIRTMSEEPVVLAVPARLPGGPGVIIASSTGPDAFLSAVLVTAVGQGTQDGTSPRHMDPRIHSPEEVGRWNARFGGEASVTAPDTAAEDDEPARGTGEARLLWGVVLLLLTAEWRLRLGSGGVR